MADVIDTFTRDDLHDLAETIVSGAALEMGYIPSPTWRPIAELPAEWRDGRLVLCNAESNWDTDDAYPMCLRFEGADWYDDTGTERVPTHYLDLAIPEVPR